LAEVLGSITLPTLVLGIESDRLFPISQQEDLARHIPGSITGDTPLALDSPYGHDGFLIESERVGDALRSLLEGP
jgi:homoserine O-acetyltransferase